MTMIPRLEGLLLLLKEVGCTQDKVHKFVFEDNLLPVVKKTLMTTKNELIRSVKRGEDI